MAGNTGSKVCVDPLHQRPDGAEVGREGDDLAPAPFDDLADLIIRGDVRSAETVNRLFRIADDEERSIDRPALAPIGLRLPLGRQQQHDLGLDRIGVLELIHQQVREPFAEVLSDLRLVAQ